MKYFQIFLILFSAVTQIQAGELSAKISVNSDRIQSPNKNVFTTMQRAMERLINETKWSNANLSPNEKIDCTFALTIIQQVSDNSFKAELFIQSRRPVYNASYVTPTLNYRDTKVEFEYAENQPLEFTQTQIDNNLVAILAFYCHLILAQDFDSFSPFGGSVFYQEAQNLATQAQSSGWLGWSAFDDNRSRTSIINAFLSESVKPYREFWYTYHRKGLDEMAANPDRGRTTILNALPVLKEIRNVRNSEILLQMFADCKLDEIVSIASAATAEEKKNTYELLRNVFPASSNLLEPLRK